MLTSLELENYRRFPNYRLNGLSRVNLLVGRNNCGKTSVLEAVHLLAAGGNPTVIEWTAKQRGEVVVAGPSDDRTTGPPQPVVSHFFHGHEFGRGSQLYLRTDGVFGTLAVGVRKSSVIVEWFDGSTRERTLDIPVTDEGIMDANLVRELGRAFAREQDDISPVQFLTTHLAQSRWMRETWDQVILDGRESEVIQAMRILEPDLSNIVFLSDDSIGRNGGLGGIVAAMKGQRRRNPLGSYGEGMHRLLSLALSMVRAEGGVLLIDEIDTGLHYSILGDMWRLVVETAMRAGVQVFATTHSLDCVRGLAWLCESYPELQSEVSLQKIDAELEEAVALDGRQIVLAVDQGMEVR
ncbi:MAG: AAA family ATPase [Planctomycetes bacterium]|nr:AAA family ATPase [Planctomycetota bacterium]